MPRRGVCGTCGWIKWPGAKHQHWGFCNFCDTPEQRIYELPDEWGFGVLLLCAECWDRETEADQWR